MKHYRILEKKGEKTQYIIQYLKKLFFGLFYWKKVNNTIHYKYEDALNEVKQIIVKDDYETPETVYHYIDAYKIFRPKELPKQPQRESLKETPIIKEPEKSTFVLKGRPNTINTSFTSKKREDKRSINRSTFIPKN